MDCTQVECNIGWHEWWLTLEIVKGISAASFVRYEVSAHTRVGQYK